MELRLNSPVGGLPAKYFWPLSKKKGYDEAKEIIQTIIWGCKDIPDLEVPLKRNILKDVDFNNYESMKSLTKRYNKAINNVLSLEKGTQKFCDRLNQMASRELLHHIIQQTYSAAVTNAEELNKYQAFSPDVYGETSFDLIAQMINQINLTKDDVFLDLGSGVGQVILQVAATSMCKTCIGIERAEVPAKYAEAMENKFKFWMQWYGKKFGPFDLLKGDFFDDDHRDKFSEATVIFVNNFAFGPAVDHKLKQRFAELKHGSKIVSSKSFCPLNFRISDRNLTDIGTIMNISEIAPNTSSVSWTDKPVSYYLHEIDRTKLEKYFQAKKNGSLVSLSTEDTETSSDSFETDSHGDCEINLVITRPPKKRGRKSKPKVVDTMTPTPVLKLTPLLKPNPHLKSSPLLKQALNGFKTLDASNKFFKVNEESSQLIKKNNIIRPSKLILNGKKVEAVLEKPKIKRGRKRKEVNRSCSPDFDSTNWISQGNLRTYSRRSSDGSASVPIGPFVNQKYVTMQENLKTMLDTFKLQYLQMIKDMSDPLHKIKVRKEIEEEIKRHRYLKLRIVELNQEIENVIVNMQNHMLRTSAK